MSISIRTSFLLLVASFSLFSSLLVVSAQNEDKLSRVSYPVAELGDCDSRESCRAYCDMTEHMNACISFAKKQGLMNEEEIKRAEAFSSKLSGGKGPGGCSSPQSCRAYCENIANIESCLSFAEENNLEADESKEARKIVTYLKSGGTMPGGCTSRASCERYCGDFSHAEECFLFAKKAGLAQEHRGGKEEDMPSEEQFKKLMRLAKDGETPGGCTSKESCESYCKADGHMEECLTFAEKAGFIDKGKAEKLKKLGGKGPGGCNSEESCHAYCSDPANQEACFAFAKEHGLVGEEDLEHMRANMTRRQEGFESGPGIGERFYGGEGRERGTMPSMPPEMSACIEEKLAEAGMRMDPATGFTPEIEKLARSCFEMDGGMRDGAERPTGYPGEHRGTGYDSRRDGGMTRPDGVQTEAESGWIARLPQDVQVCLKEKLGEGYLSLGKAGPSKETEEVLRTCFTQKGERDMGGPQNGDRPRVFPSFPRKGSTTEENRTIERSQPFQSYPTQSDAHSFRTPQSFSEQDSSMYTNQGSVPPYQPQTMRQGESETDYRTMPPYEMQGVTEGEPGQRVPFQEEVLSTER